MKIAHPEDIFPIPGKKFSITLDFNQIFCYHKLDKEELLFNLCFYINLNYLIIPL